MELHQRLLLSALLGFAAILPAAEPAVPSGDRLEQLSQLASQGAGVSAAVWDLDSNRALATLNADTRLTPASVSKIMVSAAALSTWPPDKTFRTELRSATAPREGVLRGDLVVRGSGDATLDETTLWGLAAQLRAAGLKQVTGRVLVERAPFGELGCDTIDRCRALRRSARAYNAAPSAIGVNYGSWCIAVRGQAPGMPALVGGCASGELPIALTGRVVSGQGGTPRIDRTTDDSGDRIDVGGGIASGEVRQVHRAMSDPALGAGQILRGILLQTGVNIAGGVETTLAVPAASQVLASVDSVPLQEQLGRMMRWSNNYIADVLTMNVALARRKSPPASLSEASKVLEDVVRDARVLLPQGTATPAPRAGYSQVPVLDSGSGLTTSNRLSAQDFIAVLTQQYRDSRRFAAFYGGFVVPRDAAFEFLQSGSDEWQDRVALKTGSLTEPVSVNAIAGYLRKKNGGWMAFAIIVNGSERMPQVGRERAMGAARADLTSLLRRY
ncbi:MAG: D-alanyl-D-alanine carboxypeptidase/D-alanyl-D-alanine-endopeptidase [Proteobacteria bacterium]|nr:D-alanyl-D-alanine carboxypeptidase/D-alanyl-D-alanine-endopeptidase [Pseudomonadota bacterium]MBK9253036.1 D-alanyl-D-alanine carboxypeptidase/D-alanyl-D-alanine-endopeptidase [Pseudomonadota bacterium]